MNRGRHTLTELQRYNLELMAEIDALCVEHDITYYAAGGTALGALRHEGFIPWDDDIDLYMTRDNWKRFCTAFNANPRPERVLQCAELDPSYPNMVGRYTSTTTTAIYKNLLDGQHPAGILIDIFVLDPVPADAQLQREHLKVLLQYAEVSNPYYSYANRFDVDIEYEALVERERTLGHDALLAYLQRRVERYSESETSCYMLRWGGVPHIFDQSVFGAPRRVPFENMQLPVPARTFAYLNQVYGGDWMLMPEHREPSSHEAVFDAKRSYREFFAEFGPTFDADAYRSAALARKRSNMQAAPHMHEAQDRALQLDAARLADGFARAVERACGQDGNGRTALVGGAGSAEGPAIEEAMHAYANAQASRRFVGDTFFPNLYRHHHPVYIDIGDDWLARVVEMLMAQGDLARAQKLLHARAAQPASPAPALAEQSRSVEALVQAIEAYEQKGLLNRNGCMLMHMKLLEGDAGDGEGASGEEAAPATAPAEGAPAAGVAGASRAPQPSAVQQVQFELLSELDDLLARAGIRYYLSEETALSATVQGGMPGESADPTILIHAGDALAFAQAAGEQLPEGRALESMLTNPAYPFFSFKYTNTATLCLDLQRLDNYRAPGICVFVGIIESPANAASAKAALALKLGWRELVNPNTRGYTNLKDARRARLLAKALAATNPAAPGKPVFRRIVALASGGAAGHGGAGGAGSLRADRAGSKRSTIRSEWVDAGAAAAANVYGRQFPVFAHVDEYLAETFGAHYRALAFGAANHDPFRIVDASCAPSAYASGSAARAGCEKLAEALARANEAAAPGKAPGKVLVDAWAKARAVVEGWQFEDIGAAEQTRLQALAGAGHFAELKYELLPYIYHVLNAPQGTVSHRNALLDDLALVALCEEGSASLLEGFAAKTDSAS